MPRRHADTPKDCFEVCEGCVSYLWVCEKYPASFEFEMPIAGRGVPCERVHCWCVGCDRLVMGGVVGGDFPRDGLEIRVFKGF